MKIQNVAFLSLLLSLSVIAGDKGGNGGDAIVCPDKVILLDYQEMKQRSMVLDLSGRSIQEKVQDVVEKIKLVDPYRAGLVKNFAMEITNDLERAERGEPLKDVYFTNDVLSDIPDSMEVTIPRGCVKEQLVSQRDPVFPQDKRYTISKEIWDRMDVDQQTLTVLHEAWYRTFLAEGAQDSRFARYMNATFASNESVNFLQLLEKLALAKKIGSFGDFFIGHHLVIQGNHMEFIFGDDYLSKINEKGYLLAVIRMKNGTHKRPEGRFIISGNVVTNAQFYLANFKISGELMTLLNGRGTMFALDGNYDYNLLLRSSSIKTEARVKPNEVKIGDYTVKRKNRTIMMSSSEATYTEDLEYFDVDGKMNIITYESYVSEVYKGSRRIIKENFLSGRNLIQINFEVEGYTHTTRPHPSWLQPYGVPGL